MGFWDLFSSRPSTQPAPVHTPTTVKAPPAPPIAPVAVAPPAPRYVPLKAPTARVVIAVQANQGDAASQRIEWVRQLSKPIVKPNGCCSGPALDPNDEFPAEHWSKFLEGGAFKVNGRSYEAPKVTQSAVLGDLAADQIVELKKAINDLNVGHIKLAEDDKFEPAFAYAISLLQERLGATITGIYDNETQGKLEKVLADRARAEAAKETRVALLPRAAKSAEDFYRAKLGEKFNSIVVKGDVLEVHIKPDDSERVDQDLIWSIGKDPFDYEGQKFKQQPYIDRPGRR